MVQEKNRKTMTTIPKHKHNLSGIAALLAAENTPLTKKEDEADTEFVKRIVSAYLDALPYALQIEGEIAGKISE